MPIYAYLCDLCGHQQDFLQKLADPRLTTCPACNKEGLKRQLTAAGFQLKGSGWYVTDFRDGGKKPAESGSATAPAAPSTSDAKASGESKASSAAAAPASPSPVAPSTSAAPTPSSSTSTPSPSPATSSSKNSNKP
jgi:putative FmdB family regulatory protein